MNLTSVSLDGKRVPGPFRVVASQPVVLEAFEAKPGIGRKIASGAAGGLVTERAWSAFQASNTLQADEVAKLLVKNGLAPEHAPSVAKQALDVIQSEPTKVLLVAVSAGGTAWAAVEAARSLFGMRISRLAQAAIAIAVALAGAAVYHYLKARGIAG